MESDRWAYLSKLDDELLKGGVILSEWSIFIVQQADYAFVSGAPLASILTAVAAIETHLRSEYGDSKTRTLYDLIERSPLKEELRIELHTLRKYRNKWVHVDDPNTDQELLAEPVRFEKELDDMARAAARTLRKTLYENQWL